MGNYWSCCVSDSSLPRKGGSPPAYPPRHNQARLFECCRTRPLPVDYLRLCLEDHDASAIDDVGRTPLHVLCANPTVTPELLRLLLKRCPAASRRIAAELGTPLHCLCTNVEVTPECLEALVAANPRATEVRDGGGKTPLTALCGNPTAAKPALLPLILAASSDAVIADAEGALGFAETATAEEETPKSPAAAAAAAPAEAEEEAAPPPPPPPEPRVELVPVERGEDAVFEASGTGDDSVIHRSGWARTLFTAVDDDVDPAAAAGPPDLDADVLADLHSLTESDLRSLTRDELLDLLSTYETALAPAQLAVVHDIVSGYSTEEEEDEAGGAAAPPPKPEPEAPKKPRLYFESADLDRANLAKSPTSRPVAAGQNNVTSPLHDAL